MHAPSHQAQAQPAAAIEPADGNSGAKWSDFFDPQSGSVVDAAYRNDYFGLSVPLPPGWSENSAGPPPSADGYYVLAELDGVRAEPGTILIVAQDLFFGAKRFDNIADLAADLRDQVARDPIVSIDHEVVGIGIGGRAF